MRRVGNEIKNDDLDKIDSLKESMYSRAHLPKKRPRRKLSKVFSSVKTDWVTDNENDDNTVNNSENQNTEKITQTNPDNLDLYTPKSKKTNTFLSIMLVLVGIFAVVAILFSIFYIIGSSGTVSEKNIAIKVIGPNTINSGSILELNIDVANANATDLELADLVIKYPPGTRVPTSLQTDMTIQRIPLGVIPAGSTRTGTVRAVVFGKKDSSHKIIIELEYRVKGSSALHLARASHNILILSDALETYIDANKEVVSGQFLDMEIHIISHSVVPMYDIVAKLDYPFGFDPEYAKPKATKDKDIWYIPKLDPGAEYIIKLSGIVNGQEKDQKAFKVKVGFATPSEKEKIKTELTEIEHLTEVKKPFLGIAILYDDKPAKDFVAKTGESIPIEIGYKNNLKSILSNVIIAALISGKALNKYTVSADKGFYRSLDSVAMWDKTTTNGALKKLPTNSKGRLLLRLTPKKKEDLKGVINPTIKLKIHVAGQRLSETGVPETLESTVQEEVKVQTNLELKSRALYKNNPFGVSGPVPPKLHQETKYAIEWTVTNTTNKVRDVVVTGILPPYMRWLNVKSPVSENVVYKQSEGKITWYVGEVEPGAGTGGKEPKKIVFNVGLVPSTVHIGKSPVLIQYQQLKGEDTFTGTKIEYEANNLTTDLPEDEVNGASGSVVQ